MFYILHGEEEFIRWEEVAKLKGRMAHSGLGDLNVTVFDGRTVRLEELTNACSTIPFLTDRRLIIVQDLLQRFEPRSRRGEDGGQPLSAADKAYSEKLSDYLSHLPDTTRLLFVESKSLRPSNPILKRAADIPNSYVRAFKRLKGQALEKWIEERAEAKGVRIEGQAVNLLMSTIGHDLRLLDQEMEKLAAYAGYERPVTAADVQALVSAVQETEIFQLVDALGMRRQKEAMRQLQKLLAADDRDQPPLYVLAMIARQVRLILSAKDLAEGGVRPTQIRRQLSLSHQFVVDKLLRQARLFTAKELEALLGRILEVDQAIKTGQIEPSLALELLVLGICRAERRQAVRGHQGKQHSRTR